MNHKVIMLFEILIQSRLINFPNAFYKFLIISWSLSLFPGFPKYFKIKTGCGSHRVICFTWGLRSGRKILRRHLPLVSSVLVSIVYSFVVVKIVCVVIWMVITAGVLLVVTSANVLEGIVVNSSFVVVMWSTIRYLGKLMIFPFQNWCW